MSCCQPFSSQVTLQQVLLTSLLFAAKAAFSFSHLFSPPPVLLPFMPRQAASSAHAVMPPCCQDRHGYYICYKLAACLFLLSRRQAFSHAAACLMRQGFSLRSFQMPFPEIGIDGWRLFCSACQPAHCSPPCHTLLPSYSPAVFLHHYHHIYIRLTRSAGKQHKFDIIVQQVV